MSNIGRASEKVMFLDSSDAVVNTHDAESAYLKSGLNYARHWDVVGDIFSTGNDGGYHIGVGAYRHGERANIGFFDGHAGRMHKTEMWVLTGNPETSDNAIMRRLWKLPR